MSSREIERQASEWLARLDTDDTDTTQSAFELWRGQDPRHAAAFARLKATWEQLDRVQALRPPRGIDADFLRTAFAEGAPGKVTKRISVRIALAAAAAVLGFGILWLARNPLSGSVYTTGKGGFQHIVLPDHSAIELNTDTAVRVRLDRALRKVELLRGEASFEVAHDASRPFVVAAGDTLVRAIGTKFNVRRFENSVEVLVDEGTVLIGESELLERAGSALPQAAPAVVAGQAATADAAGVRLRALTREATARRLAWQDRMLVFDSEPLSGVVSEFNRYNERQLVIVDPAVAAIRIGGYFKPTNIDAFVSVLESNFGVHAVPRGDGVILTAK